MNLHEWFKSNSWALIIAVTTIVASYAVNNYRISEIERRVADVTSEVVNLKKSDVDKLVVLAEMKKDLEYIRLQVSKLTD